MDNFEDLQYLGKEILVQMSEKQKRDMQLTRKISRSLDWVLLGTLAVSAIGYGVYRLAPEKTTKLYNTVIEGITSFYHPIDSDTDNNIEVSNTT